MRSMRFFLSFPFPFFFLFKAGLIWTEQARQSWQKNPDISETGTDRRDQIIFDSRYKQMTMILTPGLGSICGGKASVRYGLIRDKLHKEFIGG